MAQALRTPSPPPCPVMGVPQILTRSQEEEEITIHEHLLCTSHISLIAESMLVIGITQPSLQPRYFGPLVIHRTYQAPSHPRIFALECSSPSSFAPLVTFSVRSSLIYLIKSNHSLPALLSPLLCSIFSVAVIPQLTYHVFYFFPCFFL